MSSSFDPDAVESVAFDSYGTLVDVSGVADALEPHLEQSDPALVATIWRQRSLAYAMVGNAIGEYDTFYAMNRHALRFALETVGVDLEEAEREDVLSTYHELPVFDDVRDGIERVRNLGYDCYVVSNGNEAMLESLVDHADLENLLVDTISADEIEQFKPESELYRHAADRIGVSVESVAFVGAGWWDVPGAMNAGMQGVWINRQDTLWGPYDVEPDLTIETIHDLAAELEKA